MMGKLLRTNEFLIQTVHIQDIFSISKHAKSFMNTQGEWEFFQNLEPFLFWLITQSSDKIPIRLAKLKNVLQVPEPSQTERTFDVVTTVALF